MATFCPTRLVQATTRTLFLFNYCSLAGESFLLLLLDFCPYFYFSLQAGQQNALQPALF